MRNVESDIINAVVDAQVTRNHLIGRNNALEKGLFDWIGILQYLFSV